MTDRLSFRAREIKPRELEVRSGAAQRETGYTNVQGGRGEIWPFRFRQPTRIPRPSIRLRGGPFRVDSFCANEKRVEETVCTKVS